MKRNRPWLKLGTHPALFLVGLALVLRLGVCLINEFHPIFPDFYYNDARLMDANAAQMALDRDAGVDLDSMFRKDELDEILGDLVKEAETQSEKSDATLCPKCGHLF